jgi:hypothetical protein
MNCPQCGANWGPEKVMCECGYLFSSPFVAGTNDSERAGGVAVRQPEYRAELPPQYLGLSSNSDDEVEKNPGIGGFLIVIILWLALGVAHAGLMLVQQLSLLNDDSLIQRLERSRMTNVVEYLETVSTINLAIVVGGAVMLISFFVFRRYAVNIAVVYMLANMAVAVLDYSWSSSLAASDANRFLEIDQGALVAKTLFRVVSGIAIIGYLLLSDRVNKTFGANA